MDLVELFQRFNKGETRLANDTSFGAGYYPNSLTGQNVIAIENLLNQDSTKKQFPFIGEDIKVMGLEIHTAQQFTIAMATVDRYISNLDDYVFKLKQVKSFVIDRLKLNESPVQINTADNYDRESIYLTVTETSAEHGDD